jgi:PAS domain S-box-containing protein
MENPESNPKSSHDERYRQLLERASEAIVLLEAASLRVREANPAAEQLLGSGLGALREERATALFPGQPQAAGQAGLDWLLALCRKRFVDVRSRDGRMMAVEVDGAQLDYAGQPAFQLFLQPVNEHSQVAHQLRTAEKHTTIGRFFPGTLFEVINPLTVISGCLDLALKQTALPAEAVSYLTKAIAESQRGIRVLRHLLVATRQQPASRERLDLNELVRHTADFKHQEILDSRIDLQLALENGLAETVADVDQVQLVLLILLCNAFDSLAAVQAARILKISTWQTGAWLNLLVEDSGRGVPAEIQSWLFEPWVTTKPNNEGTGLGLSTARTLLNYNFGRISYRPSSLGGAGFLVELPILEPRAASPGVALSAPAAAVPGPATGPTKRILVLDDDVPVAEMVGEMVQLMGYTAEICFAPAQALQLVSQQPFDLILADFHMPGLNGRQFYEKAVQARPELARRFVFLTGDVAYAEVQSFFQTSGVPCLRKPFTLNHLSEALANALEGGGAQP